MRTRRGGFTLIEIMVVVGLVAFLATILIVALRGSIGGARVQATKSTITKVSGLLRQRIEAWNRLDFDSQFEANIDSLKAQLGVSHDLAEVLARKQLYGLHFPQTWAEVNAFIIFKYKPIDPATGQFNPAMIFKTPTSINPACESSEVLLWLLTNDKAPSIGYTQEGTDNFTGATADTDGNGALEFVDAWGNPLRWYRWPTRLIRPGGRLSTPTVFVPVNGDDIYAAKVLMPDMPLSAIGAGNPIASLSADPDDPLGLIENAYENQIGPYFQQATFEDSYHTIGTYFSPLIVSAGPDGKMGLNEPSDRGLGRGYWASPTPDNSYFDDITNHQVKSGGQ